MGQPIRTQGARASTRRRCDGWLALPTVSPLDELILLDEDGNDFAVADLWAERPVALVFLRHYG